MSSLGSACFVERRVRAGFAGASSFAAVLFFAAGLASGFAAAGVRRRRRDRLRDAVPFDD